MKLTSIFAILTLALALSIPIASAQGNPNPGVAPRNSTPYGKTYEEWASCYRLWLSGIPAETNPSLDETGEHCGEEQTGPLWFLASIPGGGSVERECHIPAGKGLYVPLVGAFAWGLEDVPTFAWLLENVGGIDPNGLSDEETIGAFANWIMDGVTDLNLVVDGIPYKDLFSYRAESGAFDLFDLDFYDSPLLPNVGVTDGYALILRPLSAGEHTIEITAELNHPLFGPDPVVINVTYELTVGR